jgi:hypothetical protein
MRPYKLTENARISLVVEPAFASPSGPTCPGCGFAPLARLQHHALPLSRKTGEGEVPVAYSSSVLSRAKTL